VLNPPRLTEHVRTLQPIQGCIGRPLSFLKPPEYASLLRKPDRKWKDEDEPFVKKKVKRSAKLNIDSEVVSHMTNECDLVLGMQLRANLRALLTLQPHDTNSEGTRWMIGRVVSLMKGSAGRRR